MRHASLVFLLACPIVAQDTLEARILALGDPTRSRTVQLEFLRGHEGFAELGDLVLYGHRHLPNEANARARCAAVAILKHAGLRAAPALPALANCLVDPYLDLAVANDAAEALWALAPHCDPKQREQLVASLREGRGPDGRRLRSGLRHKTGDHIRRIDFDGNAPWDKLKRKLNSIDPVGVGAVAEALARRSGDLQDHEDVIAKRLVTLLEEEVGARQWEWALGPAATRTLRTQLASALCHFAPRHPHTWLGWCQKLLELDPDRRIAAARALGRLRHPDALPWLLDAARRNHAEPEVAVAALRAIRGYGPATVWLVPDLEFSLPRLPKPAQPICRELIQILDGGRDWTKHEGLPVQIVGLGLPEGDPRIRTSTAALKRWLEAENGIQRERVLRDPLHATAIPPGDDDVLWIPFLRYPDKGNSEYWATTFVDTLHGAFLVSDPRSTDSQGRRSRHYGRLLYLVPMPADRTTIDAGVRYYERGPHAFVAANELTEYRALLDEMADLGLADAITIDGVIYAGWRTRPDNQHRTGVSARWRDRVPDMRILQRVWEIDQARKRR